MTAIWPELWRRRWTWCERAVDRIQRDLHGMTDPLSITQVANVMVVGDTQSGKTTVLTRLLGVRDPAVVVRIDRVLRAGRERGMAATAVPVRYRWSDRPDRWLLIRGSAREVTEHTDDEMYDILASFRSSDGEVLSWDLDDRPLEIGLPADLADDEARAIDLRVLDLPGLFAASEAERATARALVTRFAPVMTLILFVQTAYKFADAFNDDTIRDNLYLSAWADSSDGYGLVLTHAYTTVAAQVLAAAEAADASPESVNDHVRHLLATEVAQSLPTSLSVRTIANMIHPVDLGDSRRSLPALFPGCAELVGRAGDLSVERLRTTIQARAGTEYWQRAAPEIAMRARRLTAARAARRVAELRAATDRLAALEGALTGTEDAHEQAKAAQREATSRVDALQAQLDDLTAGSVRYHRPAKPPMTGDAVRAAQADERSAWTAAVTKRWSTWRTRATAAVPGCRIVERTPVSQSDVWSRYNRAVDCCGHCTEGRLRRFFGGHAKPEECWSRMSNADSEMRRWVAKHLRAGADPARRELTGEARQATARAEAAGNVCAETRAEITAQEAAVAELERAAKEAEADDQAVLAVAATVGAVLNQENRAYVEELLRELERAPAADRPWIAVAVARALLDLRRMVRDT